MTVSAALEEKRYTGVSAHPKELKYTDFTDEGFGATTGLSEGARILVAAVVGPVFGPWADT